MQNGRLSATKLGMLSSDESWTDSRWHSCWHHLRGTTHIFTALLAPGMKSSGGAPDPASLRTVAKRRRMKRMPERGKKAVGVGKWPRVSGVPLDEENRRSDARRLSIFCARIAEHSTCSANLRKTSEGWAKVATLTGRKHSSPSEGFSSQLLWQPGRKVLGRDCPELTAAQQTTEKAMGRICQHLETGNVW